MPRSTAIVRVTRVECACTTEPGRALPPTHPRYVATCADCGHVEESHLRVILDGAGTGWAQRHRVSCPKRPGVAT